MFERKTTEAGKVYCWQLPGKVRQKEKARILKLGSGIAAGSAMELGALWGGVGGYVSPRKEFWKQLYR